MTTKTPLFGCGVWLGLFGAAFYSQFALAQDPATTRGPLVHILAVDPVASETGPDTATFVIYRAGLTNEPLTVTCRVGGTALDGVDYLHLSGSVTIPAGAHRAALTVTPMDDLLPEGNETVEIALLPPAGLAPPYTVVWPGSAVAEIEDNDTVANQPPVVRLVSPPDGATFAAGVDLTLSALAGDADGRVRTVEFFAGARSLGIVTNRPTVVWPEPVRDDTLGLADESDPDLFPEVEGRPEFDPSLLVRFRLVWESVPPGEHTLTAVATDNLGAATRSAPVNIRVTDTPLQAVVTVEATDPVASEGSLSVDLESRRDTATFTVKRSGPVDFPLPVFYRLSGSAVNGVDYRELPSSVVIPRGARSAQIIIDPRDDAWAEGTESVVLTVLPPVCIEIYPPPPECYVVGRPSEARAVILDNDQANRPPVVQLIRPENGSVFLAPAAIRLVAQARDEDGTVVTVEFFEGRNSLGIVTNNPLALTANAPAFMLTWSNVPPGRYVLHALATDNEGAQSLSRPVEVEVTGITRLPVVNVETIQAEGREPSPMLPAILPAIFRVTRAGPTSSALLVWYSLRGTASNGVDYARLPGMVTIPTGASSANIVVEPLHDELVEGTETVVVALEVPPVLGPGVGANAPIPPYLIGTNSRARAFILDNDFAPTNRPPSVALARPAEGDVFEAPADICLCAEARDADGFVRSVEFFAGDRSLGIVSVSPSGVAQLFCLGWSNVAAGAYTLTARATDDRGASRVSAPVHIRVLETHRLPVVTIEAADPWASEGESETRPMDVTLGNVAFIGPPVVITPDTATFVVRRDGGTNNPLTVHYSLDGTALNGVDYVRLPGQVTIPAGAFATRIVVAPMDDDLAEGTETVIVRLAPVACPAIWPPSPACYLVGEPSRAVAYIRDNDPPVNLPPRVVLTSPRAGQTFEAPARVPIVAVAADPDGWVQTVEFFAGTTKIGEVSMQFLVEPPPGQSQQFDMVWTNVPAGRHRLTARAIDQLGASSVSPPVEIVVGEAPAIPVVTIVAADGYGREGTPPNPCVFVVRRTGPTNFPITVHYAISGTASNGVDYERLDGSVTIPAGSRQARLAVVPLDDRLPEPIETVILRVRPAALYNAGRPDAAGAVIVDDDAPAVATRPLPDRTFHLRANAPAGAGYRIEASADLLNWETLCIGTVTDDGLHFVDPDAGQYPARFYRILPDLELGDEE